jgi:hypothetical protein
MLAREFVKNTSKAYQGLTPSIRANARPVAGYQVVNPNFDKRRTSGRFKTR